MHVLKINCWMLGSTQWTNNQAVPALEKAGLLTQNFFRLIETLGQFQMILECMDYREFLGCQ